LEVKLIS